MTNKNKEILGALDSYLIFDIAELRQDFIGLSLIDKLLKFTNFSSVVSLIFKTVFSKLRTNVITFAQRRW